MFHWWLVWRYLLSDRRFFNLTTILSIVGMMIGVGSLVVAMAVISGYESTLRRSLTEVVGHVIVIKRGSQSKPPQELLAEITPVAAEIKAYTPFAIIDAALVHNQRLNGVIIQGMEPETVHDVLNLKSRLISGEFNLDDSGEYPLALVGKGLAKKFNLKEGDVFRVVMPVGDSFDSDKFRPRSGKFRLAGILDIGRHDYDTRFVVTSLKAAQNFAEIGDRYTGLRLRLHDANDADSVSFRIANELGYPFIARSWEDMNHNLFQAVKIERMVIFFVLMVIVVAASFNITSTLFVSVVRRFSDISILKTMGAGRFTILRLFTVQGLVIGFIGTILGLGLGLLLCYGFVFAQTHWGLILGSVYKLDYVDVDFRFWDLSAIMLASMAVSLISTLAPALRGARLVPAQGLHYE